MKIEIKKNISENAKKNTKNSMIVGIKFSFFAIFIVEFKKIFMSTKVRIKFNKSLHIFGLKCLKKFLKDLVLLGPFTCIGPLFNDPLVP